MNLDYIIYILTGELTAAEINTLRRRVRASIYNRAMSEPERGSASNLVLQEEPEKDRTLNV